MNDEELEKLVASKVINKASAEKLRQIKDLDQRLKEFDSLFEIGEADIENYLTYNNVTKDMLNLDSIEAENLLPKQSPAIQESTKVDTSVKEKEKPFMQLSQDLANLKGISLEKAMQEMAGFPRASRANLKGDSFPILGTIGDIFSATGRAGAAALSDEPFLESMARIDANPYTQSGEQRGFFPMFLESMARDPSMSVAPLTGAAALGAASKIKPLMKSIESGSRLAKAGRAGLAGAGATLADMTFEQSTRPEGFPMMTLGDYGLGLGLGAGLSALGGGITKPKPKPGIEGELSTSQPLINEADNPYTISQITNGEAVADAQVPSLGFGNVMDGEAQVLEYSPFISSLDRQKNLNKELKKIKEDAYIVDGKKISKKRVDAVEPILRQDYFKKFNPEFDIPAEEYVKVATAKMNPKLDSDAPRAISPLEFAVEKQAKPAFTAYKKNMNKLGKEIGDIRRETLSSMEPINVDDFIDALNNATDSEIVFKRSNSMYGSADSYKGAHSAPTDSYGSNGADLSEIFGDDIYGPNAVRYFGSQGGKIDNESVRIIQQMKKNPDKPIKIYRAVPKGKQKNINQGDWVSINKEYAENHGIRHLDDNYDIIEEFAYPGEIVTEGDIHEWGFNPDLSKPRPKKLGGVNKKQAIENIKNDIGADDLDEEYLDSWINDEDVLYDIQDMGFSTIKDVFDSDNKEAMQKVYYELTASDLPTTKAKFKKPLESKIIAVNRADGEVIDDKDLMDIDWANKVKNSLSNLKDEITGTKLSFLKEKFNDLISPQPQGSQPIYSKSDQKYIALYDAIKDLTDGATSKTLGKEKGQRLKEITAKYGRMKNTVKDIGKQLGKSVYFRNERSGEAVKDIEAQLEDYQEAFSKGENAMKRILQSQRAQGGKNNWDEVKAETGYDVAKAAAYALQAGLDAGDHTASSLLSNQQKTIQAIENIPTNREGFKSKAWEYVKKPIAAGVSKGKQAISPDENLAIRALGDVQEAITPQEYLVPDFSYIQDLYRVPEKGMRQDEER